MENNSFIDYENNRYTFTGQIHQSLLVFAYDPYEDGPFIIMDPMTYFAEHRVYERNDISSGKYEITGSFYVHPLDTIPNTDLGILIAQVYNTTGRFFCITRHDNLLEAKADGICGDSWDSMGKSESLRTLREALECTAQ